MADFGLLIIPVNHPIEGLPQKVKLVSINSKMAATVMKQTDLYARSHYSTLTDEPRARLIL